MLNFSDLKTAVAQQFVRMQAHPLFRTETDKDKIWSLYLDSFPEGTNNIYKERREYDCNCCKQFIRAIGNVVAINSDGELITLWDIHVPGFQPVVDALDLYVKSQPINNVFLHSKRTAGTDQNHQEVDGRVITWQHFYCQIPQRYVDSDPGSLLSRHRAAFDVTKRSLETISMEAVDTIIELINEKALYRGEEHRDSLMRFKTILSAYNHTDAYCWTHTCPIRNSVIGTLLVDLSEGMDISEAVASFESKVAPQNYKRPKAVVTMGMIKKAEEKVNELGLLPSLPRRHATIDDITINNIIWANRDAKAAMGVFDQMRQDAPVSVASSLATVSMDDFLTNILPTAKSVEIMESKAIAGNKVTLIAPVNPDAPNMLKWPNNFSWSYVGEVADSMKQRVKDAGGDVDGDLRFSIQWNTPDSPNTSDLDAHCLQPAGGEIYFVNKSMRHASSGMLDVDVIRPCGIAVENITFANRKQMPNGTYIFLVHVYSYRGGNSFSAELEYDGQVHSFEYRGNLTQRMRVPVAKVLCRNGQFSIVECMGSTVVKNGAFKPVSVIMNSPNHWDDVAVGNKHVFFMVDGMKQEGSVRGFYNEFLSEELTEHRKVFEHLGARMKAPESDNQLTGYGFATSRRDKIIVRVDGRQMEVQV